jgi:hypothetical protein
VDKVCTLIETNLTTVVPIVDNETVEFNRASEMVLQTYDIALNGDCGDHGSPYVADYAPIGIGNYYTDLDTNFYTPGKHTHKYATFDFGGPQNFFRN